MQTLTAYLILWIPIVFLLPALIPSSRANAHPALFGRIAEFFAWAALACAILGLGVHLIAGSPSELTWRGYFGVRLDSLSVVMLVMVSFLAGVILRYSRHYLTGDDQHGYFIQWMFFTLGAVMSISLSPGLVQLGLSWIASSMGLHQLLTYFADRRGALLSARKKFLFSRMGDFALIGAFYGIYLALGTQNLGEIFASLAQDASVLESYQWIGWLIVIGAMLKSVQLPFHTWLPDTIATPTPVSALMHAGIINGGGYLIARLSPLMIEMHQPLVFLAVMGAATAIYGSVVMQTQTSIKRYLAYSTIAQMGFMMLQCGLGAFALAVLHIFAHSLYKAHAFLASGSTIERLKVRPAAARASASPAHLAGSVVVGGLIVTLLCFIWGITLQNKPGMLVLSIVLSFACAQWLMGAWVRGGTNRDFAKSTATAVLFAASYLGLAKLTVWLLTDSTPHTHGMSTPTLQVALGVLLIVYQFSSLLIYRPHSDGYVPRWQQAFYIHALNGFYFNTIANRLFRKIGLVPAGR